MLSYPSFMYLRKEVTSHRRLHKIVLGVVNFFILPQLYLQVSMGIIVIHTNQTPNRHISQARDTPTKKPFAFYDSAWSFNFIP